MCLFDSGDERLEESEYIARSKASKFFTGNDRRDRTYYRVPTSNIALYTR